MCGEADFQYWIIAPVLNNGLVLFGELTKIVPVSETRFKSFLNAGDHIIGGGSWGKSDSDCV